MYGDSLRTGRSGGRISVWTRFSSTVQSSLESHPAFYTMGTESFSRVWSGLGVALTTSPTSKAEEKEIVELNFYSPSGLSWPVIGWTLPLPLPLSLIRQVAQDWNVFEFQCHHDIEFLGFGPSGNEAGSFSRVLSTTTPHAKGPGIKFEVFYFPQSLQTNVRTLTHSLPAI